jgi:hypothetical protein
MNGSWRAGHQDHTGAATVASLADETKAERAMLASAARRAPAINSVSKLDDAARESLGILGLELASSLTRNLGGETHDTIQRH